VTRDEAHALVLLSDAADDLAGLKRAVRRRKVDPARGDYRGVEISVGTFCDAGGAMDTYLKVDLDTGREIIDAASKIILRRLKALQSR